MKELTEAVDIAERNEDLQGLRIHTYLAIQEILDGQPHEAIARMERLQALHRSAGRETYLWPLTWALLEAGFEERAAAMSMMSATTCYSKGAWRDRMCCGCRLW